MSEENTNAEVGQEEKSSLELPDFNDYKGQYLNSLSDETQKDAYEKSLEVVKSWDTLIGGYVNAQKMIGNKVNLPSEKSSDEEWGSFFDKLGRPKDPDQYDLSNEHFKFAEDVEADIKKTLHQAGLNTKQAKLVTGRIAELSSQNLNKEQEIKEQALQAELNQRKEFYKENLAQAETEVDTFLKQLTSKEEYEKVKGLADSNNAVFNLLHKAYNETAPKNPANVARNVQANQSPEEYLDEFFKDKNNKHTFRTKGYDGFPKYVADKLRDAMLKKNG
jgi:hypothetical protein